MKQLRKKLSDCIALVEAYEVKLGHPPVPDADFARDVEEAIESRREGVRNVWGE